MSGVECPLADALDHFENSAVGAAIHEQEGMATARILSEGVRAVACALREQALRNTARETLLKQLAEGDITELPAMEAKVIEIANRISGMRGEEPTHPDPVMLLEWFAELTAAGLGDL